MNELCKPVEIESFVSLKRIAENIEGEIDEYFGLFDVRKDEEITQKYNNRSHCFLIQIVKFIEQVCFVLFRQTL